jgi:putative tricarboxylic transport membrane protein
MSRPELDTRSGRYQALLPYVVVLALSLFLLWKIAHMAFSPRGDRPGPDVWPRAILCLLAATCVVRIGVLLTRKRQASPADASETLASQDVLAGEDGTRAPAQRFPMLLALGIALTIAYIGLLGTLGFFCATVLYMASLIRTGRYRRWSVIIVVSLLGSLAFMFVFMKVVYLSLPLGRPPFDEVSLLLMKAMGIR